MDHVYSQLRRLIRVINFAIYIIYIPPVFLDFLVSSSIYFKLFS